MWAFRHFQIMPGKPKKCGRQFFFFNTTIYENVVRHLNFYKKGICFKNINDNVGTILSRG